MNSFNITEAVIFQCMLYLLMVFHFLSLIYILMLFKDSLKIARRHNLSTRWRCIANVCIYIVILSLHNLCILLPIYKRCCITLKVLPKTHYLSRNCVIPFAMLIYLVFLTYCKVFLPIIRVSRYRPSIFKREA